MSDVFDASRYHTDQRPYKVVGGLISQAGMQAVVDYLYFMRNCTIDRRQTVKSYSAFIEEYKKHIDTAIMSITIRDCVDDVRYSSRFYAGSHYPCPSPGHDLPQYRENAKTYLDKLMTFFSDILDYRSTVPPEHNTPNTRQIDEAIGSLWLVTGKGDYVGTFPKRLAKWMFKHHGVKLSASHLQTIGNLVSAHVSKDSSEIYLEFDQDFTEGSSARDYCHHDSCWWGESRRGLREGFVKEGGWAIRQFDGYSPISRCWIVWDKKYSCYVLFNSYGKTDLVNFARIVSADWGLSYSQASLYPDRDEYFINGNKCYVIADSATTEKLASTELFVNWHKPTRPVVKCDCCHAEVEDDQLFSSNLPNHAGTALVCTNCYQTCTRCSRRFTNAAMSSTTAGYCVDCAAQLHPCPCCSQQTDQAHCSDCVRRYNLVDRYEIDWEALTYRFIPAQVPPHVLNSGGSVSTAPQTTVAG